MKESLEKKINILDGKIEYLQNLKKDLEKQLNTLPLQEKKIEKKTRLLCKYAKHCIPCNQALKDNIDKIKCEHPVVKNNKAFIKSRTNEKCSIPINYDGENKVIESIDMQFCKYYESSATANASNDIKNKRGFSIMGINE